MGIESVDRFGCVLGEFDMVQLLQLLFKMGLWLRSYDSAGYQSIRVNCPKLHGINSLVKVVIVIKEVLQLQVHLNMIVGGVGKKNGFKGTRTRDLLGKGSVYGFGRTGPYSC